MAEQRYLIINADDFGEAPYNASIGAAMAAGFVTAATLLVGRRGSEEAAALARQAGLVLGLHLNLTAGNPVSDPADISSLVDADGKFFGKDAAEGALEEGRFSPDHIAHECRAQLHRFAELVVDRPSHVDGHHHVHVRPQVAEVVAPILAAQGVHRVRLPREEPRWFDNLDPARLRWAQQLHRHACKSVDCYRRNGIRSPGFMGLSCGGHDCTLDRVVARLAASSPGITEYMVHIAQPGTLPATHPASVREIEWQLITSTAFRSHIEALGFKFVGYDAV